LQGDIEGRRAMPCPQVLQADMAILMIHLYRHVQQGTLCPVIVESVIYELSGTLGDRSTAERRFPPWLRQCIDYVNAEYPTSITVKDLARDIGVHPVHLAREFRRRLGETLGEYVNKIRLKAACRQILEDNGTLADIAMATGFYDQSHFVRVFRAALGCPPSAF